MNKILSRTLAVFLLGICSPILVVVSLLILCVERDSVLFLQPRLGQHKIPFTIYKLRTMKNGKITFIGKVLRKTGIDEIPQLLNIIKGDITFIGPRPLTQFDIDRLEWTSDFYAVRWNVHPGLTGLAQLSPICHKKMTLFWDTYYVKYHSFRLDVKIICASMLTLFIGKRRVKAIIQKNLEK